MAWTEFFAELLAKGRAGVFVEGLFCLWFGALVVAFHNIWSGLPAILTIVGWLQVLKGLLRLTVPGLGLRIYERIVPERAWAFRIAGVFGIALGGLFTYLAFRL